MRQLVKAFQELYWLSALMEYIKVIRVESWLGWIFSFGFGSIFLNLPLPERFFAVFVAFLLATSSVFVLNQYFDRKEDKENAFKSGMSIASGRIAPRTALIFSLLLSALCLVLVIMIDANLLSLFVVYLAFGTAYSAPPLRLKNVPVVDFIVSGLGAGFMPFVMGLNLTDGLSFDISTITLVVVPLTLVHCGGHVIQAIGDYEVDRKMGTHTFVVKYGKQKGALVAGFMFLLACFSPFIYSVFGLLPYRHLIMFFALFPFSIPIIRRYAAVLGDPSAKNVISMQKTATKYGIIGITLILGYTLLVKVAGF